METTFDSSYRELRKKLRSRIRNQFTVTFGWFHFSLAYFWIHVFLCNTKLSVLYNLYKCKLKKKKKPISCLILEWTTQYTSAKDTKFCCCFFFLCGFFGTNFNLIKCLIWMFFNIFCISTFLDECGGSDAFFEEKKRYKKVIL